MGGGCSSIALGSTKPAPSVAVCPQAGADLLAVTFGDKAFPALVGSFPGQRDGGQLSWDASQWPTLALLGGKGLGEEQSAPHLAGRGALGAEGAAVWREGPRALGLPVLPPTPNLSVHGGPAFREHWGTGPWRAELSPCGLRRTGKSPQHADGNVAGWPAGSQQPPRGFTVKAGVALFFN